MHTTCFPIHWAMVSSFSLSHCNMTLKLARAAAGLELISQFFCCYTYWKFMSCLHCSGLVPCLLCQTWCLNVLLTILKSFGWFYWIGFHFAMAEIYECCWLWIPCLDHVNLVNAFYAHCINPNIAYITLYVRICSTFKFVAAYTRFQV